MNYYLTTGINGIILTTSFKPASYWKRYLPHARVRKYTDYAAAEQAAIEHIYSIKPPYIEGPAHIQLDEMVTVNILIKKSQSTDTLKESIP